MLRTYKAILHGDTLEWVSEKPSLSVEAKEVHVTVWESISNKPSKQQAVQALRDLAARGGISSFGDALEWQRNARQDRVLPGREEP